MKIWFPLLCPTIFALAVAAPTITPTPFDASKVDFSQISDEDMAKTEAHRNELLGKLNANLDTVATVASDAQLGKTNANIKAATDKTAAAFGEYKHVAEDQIRKGNVAILQLNHVLKKLHLAKMIATGFLLAVAGFIALKIPPPLGLYAAGAVFVGGTAAIWMFL